jgi:hypothetical protein
LLRFNNSRQRTVFTTRESEAYTCLIKPYRVNFPGGLDLVRLKQDHFYYVHILAMAGSGSGFVWTTPRTLRRMPAVLCRKLYDWLTLTKVHIRHHICIEQGSTSLLQSSTERPDNATTLSPPPPNSLCRFGQPNRQLTCCRLRPYSIPANVDSQRDSIDLMSGIKPHLLVPKATTWDSRP